MALSTLQIKMIRRLLDTGTEGKIAHALEKIHPTDLTFLFSELSEEETQRLVNALVLIAKAGKTITELPDFMIPDILGIINDKKLTEIISRLEPDDAYFLLEKIEEGRREVILQDLPEGQRLKLQKMFLYPKDSAGSVMTSDFVQVRADMTVQEAIESLRRSPDTPGIFYIYVVDEENRLVGVQSLRSLVVSPPETKIRDSMSTDVRSVLATKHQEEAAQLVAQYNVLAIPVVGPQQELLGVITVDDVIDIVKEEATEDIYHLAGLSEEDRASTPVWLKVKKRLPWMGLNLGTALLASSVVGFFQESIQRIVALAILMPIVAGMGGNSAAQSLTVITRSIALGELNFVKNYKVILAEAGSGLMVGACCGLMGALVGYFWMQSFTLGLVLFLALTLNLFIGGLAGAAVPIILKSLKLDPAVGSSVFVTTFTDVCGFLAFLGLATWMM